MPQDAPLVAAVSVGGAYTCAISAATGQPFCFGTGNYGQLDVPADIPRVKAIAAGLTYACAIKEADSQLVSRARG